VLNRNTRIITSSIITQSADARDICEVCEVVDGGDAEMDAEKEVDIDKSIVMSVWKERKQRNLMRQRFASRAERELDELSRTVVYDFILVRIR
jgi:hypothetical protein